jgi:hypothetical protein
MEVSGQLHVPIALPLGKIPRAVLDAVVNRNGNRILIYLWQVIITNFWCKDYDRGWGKDSKQVAQTHLSSARTSNAIILS